MSFGALTPIQGANTSLTLNDTTTFGSLTLKAADTYTGNTTIIGGTLVVANSLALQNSAVLDNISGQVSFGTLTSATLGGLAGSVDMPISSLTALTLNTGAASGDLQRRHQRRRQRSGLDQDRCGNPDPLRRQHLDGPDDHQRRRADVRHARGALWRQSRELDARVPCGGPRRHTRHRRRRQYLRLFRHHGPRHAPRRQPPGPEHAHHRLAERVDPRPRHQRTRPAALSPTTQYRRSRHSDRHGSGEAGSGRPGPGRLEHLHGPDDGHRRQAGLGDDRQQQHPRFIVHRCRRCAGPHARPRST